MIHVIVGNVSAKQTEVSVEELLAQATTPALFGTQTFMYAGVLTGDSGEEVLEILDLLKKSPHTFVFEEEKLLKKPTDALAKAGIKVKEVKAKKQEWKFDQFGLTFALQAKDKKRLWLGLMQAFRAGEKAEAVAGLLAWKARAMKDVKLSRELMTLYHDSHRGAGDLELLLERFALKL
jgi:hypothetical protein